MRLIISIAFIFVSLTVFPQRDTSISLSTGWTFSLENSKKSFHAEVPGCIYTDLLSNELIDNPFFGNNEQKLQWVSDSAWVYRNAFIVEAKLLQNQHVEIAFEGLDTYSEVWLNDSLIFVTNNMFRIWRKEVKPLLKPGINEIKIQFEPVAVSAKMDASKLPYTLSNEERVFVRKAQFQFGWDFAPRFISCGIWRPVKIITWNSYKINDIQIVQNHLSSKLASLTAQMEIVSEGSNEVNVTIFNKKNGKKYMASSKKLIKGMNKCIIDFVIEEPEVWWCNGLGKPNLYDIEINIADRANHLLNITKTIGLRNIEVVQEQDSIGKNFYFKVNGFPVFIKGANYVPANYFPSMSDTASYSRVINNAVKSNMNMLRVWGGGIYENDDFYDLCDKNGILVWQDFMFAGAMYPGDSAFLNNVRVEVTENIKRLRNHPCIALWCGNNEISEGWNNWGWQKQYAYSKSDSIKIWNDYRKLFYETLPQIITKTDSTRFYWPSSPETGWGRKESLLHGDCHYWGVWWGMEPFENYKTKIGRFMSEYGFQGMLSKSSIIKFANKEDLDLSSETMRNHQKHKVGYETIQTYMEKDYSRPKNFEDYIYISQLMQAHGIKMAIDAHRRSKPYCMGTLYWQMNDCWPAISWSGIDYYGNWKAMQYIVKREYQNTLVSIVEENDSIYVYSISDNKETVERQLRMKLITFDGKLTWDKEISLVLPANSSSIVFKISLKELLKKNEKSQLFFVAGFTDQTKQDIQFHYFQKYKELPLKPLEIQVDCKVNEQGCFVSLKSAYLVKGLYVTYNGDDTLFDDNFFDMIPGETYVLRCKKKISKDALISGIELKYLTN